jgi:hypothetical protein
MSGALVPGDDDRLLVPEPQARLLTGSGDVVLQFPVEIEVRLVSPHDPDHLIAAALDRLTADLHGLA